MLFSYEITVPANTLKTAPVEQEMALAAGVIRQVAIQFPAGCNALVHVQVMERDHQLFPTNLDTDIAASGFVLQWAEDYELVDAPYSLKAVLWNDDDTYPHTVTLRITVLSSTVMGEAQQSVGIIRRMGQMLGLVK